MCVLCSIPSCLIYIWRQPQTTKTLLLIHLKTDVESVSKNQISIEHLLMMMMVMMTPPPQFNPNGF